MTRTQKRLRKKGGMLLNIIVAALIATALMSAFFELYRGALESYGLEGTSQDLSAFNDTQAFQDTAKDVRVHIEGESQVSTRLSEVNLVNAGFTAILRTGPAIQDIINMASRAADIIGVPGYVLGALIGVLFVAFGFGAMKILTGRN